MQEENIGKIIREIRLKNNLSQKEFADKFGVTFQAVSKWENGKNIPDIAILKDICKEYNLSLDELINNSIPKKNKRILFISLVSILVLISITLLIVLHHNNFEFKMLSSNCSDFTVTGSIAYNKDKTSIYISNINYCGNKELEKYDTISCTFYEDNGKSKVVIDKCNTEHNLDMKEFLDNVHFHVDNYIATCKKYTENSLYLEIDTYNNGNINTFKVPLKLTDNCGEKKILD